MPKFPFLKIALVGFIFMGATNMYAQQTSITSIAPKSHTGEIAKKDSPKGKVSREATLLLKEEIEANRHNPAYPLAANLQKLYSSPYVLRGLNIYDETFPIQVMTGDREKDMLAKEASEKEWIKNNPERYAAILLKMQKAQQH